MPKVLEDLELLNEVSSLIKRVGGVPQAAKILHVNRTTLWRFAKSGKAINNTKQLLSEGILRNRSVSSESDVRELLSGLDVSNDITSEDLKAIRNLCSKMMALIDNYEQLPSSQKRYR